MICRGALTTQPESCIVLAMEATVKLDDVLDLVYEHQQELAVIIDQQMPGTNSYRLLWEEYRHVTELYDNIRREAS